MIIRISLKKGITFRQDRREWIFELIGIDKIDEINEIDMKFKVDKIVEIDKIANIDRIDENNWEWTILKILIFDQTKSA